jgi:hypothetical protein
MARLLRVKNQWSHLAQNYCGEVPGQQTAAYQFSLCPRRAGWEELNSLVVLWMEQTENQTEREQGNNWRNILLSHNDSKTYC